MDFKVNPILENIVTRQKLEVGSRVNREVLEHQMNELFHLLSSLKVVDSFLKSKQRVDKNLKSLQSQYSRLMFGNSAMSSH
mmetsp:Transcript_39045/g.59486  ORF Transcript_39045/g.59486 Transcript_39045/m.59486 type:complete len:81 (+) Transcript_39045:651-893(+)